MAARIAIQQGDSKKGGKQYKGINISLAPYAQLVALARQNRRTIKAQIELLIEQHAAQPVPATGAQVEQ